MFKLFAGSVVFVIVFVLFFLLAPAIALASINTLAEEAGTDLYIPHTIYSYLSIWGLMFVFRGTATNKES